MTTTEAALAQDIGLARETDYFMMKDQLTEDELALLYKVRRFAETEVLPVVNRYWERDEFPFELVPRFAELNIVGDTMAGYGTTPMSAVGSGLLTYELSRVDGSIGTSRLSTRVIPSPPSGSLSSGSPRILSADAPHRHDRMTQRALPAGREGMIAW